MSYKPYGYGFINKRTDKACMIRCFRCGNENYAPNVMSGTCSVCSFDSSDDPTILAEMKLMISDINPDGSMRRSIQ